MPSGASLATLGAAGIGAAGSMMGKSKQSQVTTPELPPELKEAYLQQILPAARETFNRPRPLQEYERVGVPQSAFDSQELYKLQQASDAQGGLSFNRRKLQPLSEDAAMSSSALKKTQDAVIGRALVQGLLAQPTASRVAPGAGINPQTDAEYAAIGRLGANPREKFVGLLNTGNIDEIRRVLEGVTPESELFGAGPFGLLNYPQARQALSLTKTTQPFVM